MVEFNLSPEDYWWYNDLRRSATNLISCLYPKTIHEARLVVFSGGGVVVLWFASGRFKLRCRMYVQRRQRAIRCRSVSSVRAFLVQVCRLIPLPASLPFF